MHTFFKDRSFKATLFAVILIFLQLAGGITLGIINSAFNLNLSTVSALIIAQIGLLFIPVVLYFIITKEPVRETLRLNPLSFPSILRIILITIFIQPLVMAISAIGNLFFHNYLTQVTMDINNSVSLPVMLILTALFPAVFEEISLRGIVFTGFTKKRLWIAALVNGLLFAVLHLNIQQGLYAFVLGYIFVYLVDATNSIFASVISHFLINGSQMTLLHFTADSLAEEGQTIASIQQSVPKESLIATILFLLFLASIFTFIAYRIYRKLKISNTPPIYNGNNNTLY